MYERGEIKISRHSGVESSQTMLVKAKKFSSESNRTSKRASLPERPE
jgi:hypothetical protein